MKDYYRVIGVGSRLYKSPVKFLRALTRGRRDRVSINRTHLSAILQGIVLSRAKLIG